MDIIDINNINDCSDGVFKLFDKKCAGWYKIIKETETRYYIEGHSDYSFFKKDDTVFKTFEGLLEHIEDLMLQEWVKINDCNVKKMFAQAKYDDLAETLQNYKDKIR